MKEKILEWIWTHQRHLLAGVGVSVGIVVLAIGALTWQNHRENKAMAALNGAQGQLEALQKITTDYPMTRARRLAFWQWGDVALKAQKYEEASGAYETLYKKAGEPLLRVVALYGLAGVHQEKKEFSQAAEIYSRAALEPGNLAAPYSDYLSARFWELAGDKEKAQGVYKKLSDNPDLPGDLKQTILDRQLWLAIQK